MQGSRAEALPPSIAAAQRFVHLVTSGEPPSIAVLARGLDELAARYHETPQGDPDESEAERPGDRIRYAEVGARFPDLGFYAVAFPLRSAEEALIGDAIDDLMEIANDLRTVLWRFETFGPDDAHWHYRFLFEAHWGRHLRELAHYLHAKQFG